MPDITFTSDVIVGFPGESYEEFLDTVSLIRQVEFVNLFTFIYSPRPGTKAASMPDPVSHEEKTRWFAELLKVQEEIASQNCRKLAGSVQRVLVENKDEKSGLLSGRTAGSLTGGGTCGAESANRQIKRKVYLYDEKKRFRTGSVLCWGGAGVDCWILGSLFQHEKL